MKVHGSCHCGQLTFEADVDPEAVRICHCTDCQTMTGSAYRVNVAAPAATFVMRSGQPKIYIRMADSGNPRAHAFCANCGTQIYSAAPQGSADLCGSGRHAQAARAAAPRSQIWFRSALPWVTDLGNVRQIERQ
jgi:hypothetical protein